MPGGNGALIKLTRMHEEAATKCKLENWAPKDFDFKEFKRGLVSMQDMPSCPACLKGGGNPTCKVRICATNKRLDSCNQCNHLK